MGKFTLESHYIISLIESVVFFFFCDAFYDVIALDSSYTA